MDNLARSKLIESTPHAYRYRWYRSATKSTCANDGCLRSPDFNPVEWTQHSLGAPTLVCAYCAKSSQKSSHNFCSKSCFKQSWKKHAKTHNYLQGKTKKTSEGDDSKVSRTLSDGELVFTEETVVTAYMGDWILINEEDMYIPTAEDVGYCIKVECFVMSQPTKHSAGEFEASGTEELLVGPVQVYSEPVLNFPSASLTRNTVTPTGDVLVGDKAKLPEIEGLRVATYNILAEIYATKMAYPYCDNWMLSWPYRRTLILQEIFHIDADIVCLQEIQSDHYESDLLPRMRIAGYDGVFRQKSREGMGQYGKVDGCAVFWQTSKLKLAEYFDVDFNEEARSEATRNKMSDNNMRKYLTRVCKDNIAQIIEFEFTASGAPVPRFCVANTHLYSNSRQPDVKLLQTWILLSRIQRYLSTRRQQGFDLGLILCGDFNSQSDSAVYKFLTEGAVSESHPELGGLDQQSNVLPDFKRITHSLALSSAMAANGLDEPYFTNYTVQFRGTLDYIWYTPSNFTVESYLSIPSEEEILKNGQALPSAVLPSDHILLCCNLSCHLSNRAMGFGASTLQKSRNKFAK